MDGFGVGYWSTVSEEFNQIARDTASREAKAKAGAKSEDRKGDDGMGQMEMDDLAMRPILYKCTRPPLNDLNLRSLCNGTKTKGLLAHIRAGTVSWQEWTPIQTRSGEQVLIVRCVVGIDPGCRDQQVSQFHIGVIPARTS